jgi:hypothetical protein
MEAENHLLKKDAAIAQVSLPGEVFMHGEGDRLILLSLSLFHCCHDTDKGSGKGRKNGDKCVRVHSAHPSVLLSIRFKGIRVSPGFSGTDN